MLEIAEKFKSIGKIIKSTNTSSSIFGSAGSLAQSVDKQALFRIGFYPIIDSEKPEIAMGVASCLCYLLEQYNDVEVYRIFAKIELNNDDEIGIEDSQFSAEQWSFEGLNDNIIIFGNIKHNESINTLEIIIDRSLLDEADDNEFSYQFSTLSELINQLPLIAKDIITEIKSDVDESELIISYSDVNNSAELLDKLIEEIFYWNLDLYLYLWNVEWDDDEITTQFKDFLNLSKQLNQSFGIWSVAMLAKQVMQIGLDVIGDVVVPLIDEIFEQDSDRVISIASLCVGLVDLGYVEQALRFVEEYSSDESTNIHIWITLIDIYSKAGQFDKAISANQQAIENGIEDIRLYWRYTQLLLIAESNDWFIEELLFIDPDVYDEDEHMTQEIIASLEGILKLDSENIRALHKLLPYLIELNDIESIWGYFKRLVELDKTTHYTQDIISHLYDVDNLDPAYAILLQNSEQNPDNPYVFLNLAQLAALDENVDVARKSLNQAEAFVAQYGDELETEIQTVRLSVTFPEFEQQYSEIKIVLNANRSASETDVEFLEEAIEIAPKLGHLYVTLAQCYLGWQDSENALEVLHEGNTQVGKHPQIIMALGQVLWKQGKRDQAFEHLNDGIQQFPNNVSLLTQIAGFLIENEQLDDAKPYIERADIIAPSHPSLWNLKKIIADKLSK